MPAAYDHLVKALGKKKGVKNKYALAHAIMSGEMKHPKTGMMMKPKGK